MSTEPKWLLDERTEIIAKHPELTGIRNFPIGTLRSAAASIEASKAQAAPLPRPSKAAREQSTAELIKEAARLTSRLAELKASAKPAEPKMPTGELQSEYLDRVMGVPGTRFAADATRTTVDSGAVQRFGVRVPKGSR